MTIESDALKKVDNDYRKFTLDNLDTYIKASEPEYRDGISGLRNLFASLDTDKDNILINTMMYLIRPIHNNCNSHSNGRIFNNLYETIKMVDKREEVNQLTQEKNQFQIEKGDLLNQIGKLTEQSKMFCNELNQAQMAMDGTHHDCVNII